MPAKKIAGRWQPVTAAGHIRRDATHNVDYGGYSTKQGALEAYREMDPLKVGLEREFLAGAPMPVFRKTRKERSHASKHHATRRTFFEERGMPLRVKIDGVETTLTFDSHSGSRGYQYLTPGATRSYAFQEPLVPGQKFRTSGHDYEVLSGDTSRNPLDRDEEDRDEGHGTTFRVKIDGVMTTLAFDNYSGSRGYQYLTPGATRSHAFREPLVAGKKFRTGGHDYEVLSRVH